METKEEKLERLRKERNAKILSKKQCQEYVFDGTTIKLANCVNSKILHVGMIVRIKKPDNTYRRGIVEYIKIVNQLPEIGVICGKKNIKFIKTYNDVYPDNKIEDILKWEEIEVPERLTKMSTSNLLREFRKFKYFLINTNEAEAYKKELYLREHIGETNAKAQKNNRKKKSK